MCVLAHNVAIWEDEYAYTCKQRPENNFKYHSSGTIPLRRKEKERKGIKRREKKREEKGGEGRGGKEGRKDRRKDGQTDQSPQPPITQLG